MTYRVIVRPPAQRALRGMPEKIATAAYEFITGPLADNPHRVGKPLVEPLAPLWSARRGEYRALYLIDDDQVIVEVTALRHRRGAYRSG